MRSTSFDLPNQRGDGVNIVMETKTNGSPKTTNAQHQTTTGNQKPPQERGGVPSPILWLRRKKRGPLPKKGFVQNSSFCALPQLCPPN